MLSFVQSVSSSVADGYELRFAALERGAHGMTFPCDAQGRVEAVLGVDYPADAWLRAALLARLSAMGALALLITIVTSATVVVSPVPESIQVSPVLCSMIWNSTHRGQI